MDQADLSEFEANVVYRVSSKIHRETLSLEAKKRKIEKKGGGHKVVQAPFSLFCLPLRTQALINIVADTMELWDGCSQERTWRQSQAPLRLQVCSSFVLGGCGYLGT